MPPKKNSPTIIERFGFKDPDLSQSDHDNIIHWIDDNAEAVAISVLKDGIIDCKIGDDWGEDRIKELRAHAAEYVATRLEYLKERIESIEKSKIQIHDKWYAGLKDEFERLDRWDGLGDPPLFVPLYVTNKIWESPVVSDTGRSKYTVGFVDLEILVYLPSLSTTTPNRNEEIEGGVPAWNTGSYDYYKICFEAKTKLPTLGELLRQINMYKEYKRGIYVVVCHDDSYSEKLKEQGVGFIKYPIPPSKKEAGQGQLF